MRLTWTCFLRDVAVADAATIASSKRTKVFIVVVAVAVAVAVAVVGDMIVWRYYLGFIVPISW
jgi:ABC-type enterochelin transport system permease subunit